VQDILWRKPIILLSITHVTRRHGWYGIRRTRSVVRLAVIACGGIVKCTILKQRETRVFLEDLADRALAIDPYLTFFWAAGSFMFGAVIGSFLNVVIHRLPAGESLVRPASKCPACGHDIRFYDNVPIVSYFILLGRCRDCGGRISWRYPLVEFLSACLCMALNLKWGITPAFAVWIAFCFAMMAVFWIDLDHMIIPDVISLNGIAVGLIAATAGLIPGMNWKLSMIGTVLGGAILFVPAIIYEQIRGVEGLGGGDIKLLAMIGSFTGIGGVMFVLFVSSLLGSISALAGIAIKGANAKTPIPFGPFLTTAAVIYVFFGPEIIDLLFAVSLRF